MATDSTDPGDRAADDGGELEPTQRTVTMCPGGDRVVILRDEPAERVGNILLPDSAKAKTTRGRVVAMGPGKLNSISGEPEPYPFEGGLHVGDFVLFGRYAGHEVEFGGTEYTVMSAGELLAKIVPGGA